MGVFLLANSLRSIKKSGVTKFSVFLDKKIDSIRISGNNADLIK